ncbi:5-oxoprolinase subunit C family protein [Pedobacter psychroterrae]|uniref:Biotin-dependent carboxyltransferase n=1 Tax=Pedobacter psychroterrae TaxID=2530453 RepID=A0A4R0NAW7_9SPHI|nr:biotin-dependent carboxyltransferase family protein [Pedobacter psychroterrae]TCC97421.1 biotin-dependent carboxyltransferase [Pedobacter psychroterrae]
MGFKVVKAGMLSTIQDLGRYGYQKSGIIVSGAMDKLALRIGNLLLGNEEDEAGLEITLIGPVLLFEEAHLIILTGADLSPSIDGAPLTMWRPVHIPKGSLLTFGKPASGCRAYLSVAGGFKIKPVLGSCATYLQAGIGGWEGRALKPGDRIPFKQAYKANGKFNWTPDLKLYPRLDKQTIGVIAGPEFSLFTKDSIAAFFSQEFSISKDNNRMGYRLDGAGIHQTKTEEMLSSAVTFGTIQVPQQGKPIILMADSQTTGGYPRIAQVITAALSILAQKQTGSLIKFELITLAEAQKQLQQQEKQIQQLKHTISLKYG